MAVFKCKMCGGNLEISEGVTVCECDFCGVRQTVPYADNEKKINLFNRANRLRMASEFDKASVIYETIIADFPEEAEAYWGLCLCNYGIEYVDDPTTANKVPTCHRASFESIQKDENYLLALEYADVLAQKVYRDEAREIDRIMNEILVISKNEKPYDVFICYKETDENGERTMDSVIAYDLYEALTAKGLKVFFSRVTLEDKLGMQYEPYIFAALNSSKVMLSIGTKYEYYQAVWVKNEWSRFLKLMAKDKSKVLIPCFKDIDAYDMPDEFKALQAQDMNKLGAIQDIVRGVEKILGKNTSQPSVPAEDAPSIISNVSSINTKNYNELWPKGSYSNSINYNENNVICFHIYVFQNLLQERSEISLRFLIFNSAGNKIADDTSKIKWNNSATRISKPWSVKRQDGSVVPVGTYRAMFSIDNSKFFEYTFTVTSNEAEKQKRLMSATQANPRLSLVAAERQNGPVIISNVCSIGTRNYNELWPKGHFTNVINYDQLYVMCFNLSVIKSKLSSKKSVTLGFWIYNEKNELILEEETVLDWHHNYDKISKSWIVRGDDGGVVPTGRYRAEFSVENSKIYDYTFYVTSNRLEQMKKARALEMQKAKELQRWNESQKIEEIMRQRRAKNLCQHCGGTFKGYLGKVCSNCGKKKDY